MIDPNRFEFDGQMLTIAEIKQLVPCLSAPAIRKHLKGGRNTKQQMLYFNTSKAKAHSSRANGSKLRQQSWKQAGFKV